MEKTKRDEILKEYIEVLQDLDVMLVYRIIARNLYDKGIRERDFHDYYTCGNNPEKSDRYQLFVPVATICTITNYLRDIERNLFKEFDIKYSLVKKEK